MSSRSLGRSPLNALIPLSGLCLWAACSSAPTDFFGAPHMTGGAGGSDPGGLGGASGGSTSANGGSGGANAGSGASTNGGTGTGGGSGGDGATGGSATPAGAANGGGTNGGSGGTKSDGVGGSAVLGGMSGDAGAGDTSNGGSRGGTTGGTTGGNTMAGEAGAPAGMAGESSAGAGPGGGAGTSSGGAGVEPSTCAGDGECAPTEYCKKTACDAATGTCEARRSQCVGADATFAPVCGCDHMTYYTACVAAREGINVAASGECGAGGPTCTRTGGGDSCTPHRNHAACYRERTNCSGSGPTDGVCWVLPDECPTETTTQLYCNQGGPTECHALCEGIDSGLSLIRNASDCAGH